MSHDTAFIDRIVAGVLDQLQSPAKSIAAPASAILPPPQMPASPAPQSAAVTQTPASTAITATVTPVKAVSASPVNLNTPVVTAAVLDKAAIPPGSLLLVGPKSVLTPSAHDWLRHRKISWKRSNGTASPSAGSGDLARWQLLVSTVTPTVRSLLDQVTRSHADWKRQLLGGPDEIVEVSVRLLATAEAQRVFVIAGAAEAMACRANRNTRVRAAVIATADQLKIVETELAPNLIVVNPAAKSLMELRHLVRACSLLPAPKPPEWAQGK